MKLQMWPGGQKKALLGVEKPIRIYAGQYYDSETGLHYNYNRYYDPTLGRYLKADPIGLAGGVNLFAYVQNNPINSIDPWGLAEYLVIWSTESGSDPNPKDAGVVGGMKVAGTIISSEVDKYNHHASRSFEGFFPGVSFPFPISKTSNIGVFEDKWMTPDLNNILGNSQIMTSFSFYFGDVGFSGPSYIRFGELYMQNMATIGVDISAGSAWTGSISFSDCEGSHSDSFYQTMIDQYKLK